MTHYWEVPKMEKTIEQLKAEHSRQQQSLWSLNDEVMSALHAHPLRQPSIDSTVVVNWLRDIYDEVQVGLGKPRRFNPLDANSGDPPANT